MDVTDYIANEMTLPFSPGFTDCANTADRWFAHRRGYSAMTAYGRRVTSAADMQEWLNEPGGIIRGMRHVMNLNECLRTAEPVAGDIGILILGTRACIAIHDLTGWWSRDDDGFITADDSYRRIAWSIG